jgi:hypothetical protein
VAILCAGRKKVGYIVKSEKAKKQAVVADGMTQAEIDLENAAQDALCGIGSAVMKGRNHEEQIALAKKLIAQVETAGIAEKVALDFKGVDDNTLGNLSCALLNELSDTISKGRTLAEEIGLVKQLRYQVEMMDSPEPKTSEKTSETKGQDDFAADDEIFIEHAIHFYRNLRRKAYRSLCFLASLEKLDCWIFPCDNQDEIVKLKEAFYDVHKKELADIGPETIKIRKAS